MAGGGQIVKVAPWGRRRLAYPIDRHREGSYHIILFEAPSGAVAELERQNWDREQVHTVFDSLEFRVLRERLAIYPEYATRSAFLDPRLGQRGASLGDSEGFVRPDLEVWRHW